jgi:hypothetical protein
MSMRTVTAVLVVVAVGAGLPAPALAKLRPIPPSNPAANQYVESVPTAGGAAPSAGLKLHPSSHSGSAVPGTPAGGGAVPTATGSAMVKSGSDGRQAAIFAQATAPARHGSHTSRGSVTRQSAPASGTAVATSAVRSTSAPLAVVRSLTGVDGVGALPVVLILVALAITAVAVYRRRTT